MLRSTAPIGLLLVLLASALAACASPDVHDDAPAGIRLPAEAAPTTLYMHLDGLQDFPMSTQRPDDFVRVSQGWGLTTHSVSCIRGLPGGQYAPPLASNSYHTWYGYSSPVGVEYPEGVDRPLHDHSRGIAHDVVLDPSGPATVTWLLETQASSADGPGTMDPNTAPLLLPDVVVRATLREGDRVGLGGATYNEGRLIAVGQTDPATLGPDQTAGHPHVSYSEVDGRHVYRFDIPLELFEDRISRDPSFNVRMDVFVDNPLCDDPQHPEEEYLMPNQVRVHSTQDHRPAIHLTVTGPLHIQSLTPGPRPLDDGTIAYRMEAASPWGAYDVDPQRVHAWVEGPDGTAWDVERLPPVTLGHSHGAALQPRIVDHAWTPGDAPPGGYRFHIQITNLQGTANATAWADFDTARGTAYGVTETGTLSVVQWGPGRDSPGPAAPLLAILLLAGGAWAARRAARPLPTG